LKTTLNVEKLGDDCLTGCSDRIPCSEQGAYCSYELGNGTYGFCDQCSGDEDEDRRKCYLSGLHLNGARECADVCGSTLFASSCKICGKAVVSKTLESAQDGEPRCNFCNDNLKESNFDNIIRFMGKDTTCFEVNQFFSNYDIAQDNPNCELARGFNHLCGCGGSEGSEGSEEISGYAGADTLAKRRALVWVPRVTSIISMIGSLSIIADVRRDTARRRTPHGQLMMALSIFDFMGSLAYSFTSLPIPEGFGIEGAGGNDASCTAQGFFIQMGTIAALFNVSLATYYFLVIQRGWGDTMILDVRIWFFICPIIVGMAFAFAGIPFYDMLFIWCNNSNPYYWPEIPVFLAILATTCIMASICYDVWKTEKASSGDRMSVSGQAPETMTSRMFWQSLWYCGAFWLTWIPYLALQYAWNSGEGYTSYPSILIPATLVTLQGCWNAVIYFRRRARKRFAGFLSRHGVTTGTSESSQSNAGRSLSCCMAKEVTGQVEDSTKTSKGTSKMSSQGTSKISSQATSLGASKIEEDAVEDA